MTDAMRTFRAGRIHGATSKALGPTAEYALWTSINHRCTTPHKQWKDYGGRGISVCPEWRPGGDRLGFVRFLEHVGPKPGPEYTLDRIDNDGNYEPGNVRWATRKEQAANRRVTRLVRYNGEDVPISWVADQNGMARGTLHTRVFVDGMSLEDALRKPVRDGKATHCNRGHAFDAANTRIAKSGRQHCRKCAAELARNVRSRNKLRSARDD